MQSTLPNPFLTIGKVHLINSQSSEDTKFCKSIFWIITFWGSFVLHLPIFYLLEFCWDDHSRPQMCYKHSVPRVTNKLLFKRVCRYSHFLTLSIFSDPLLPYSRSFGALYQERFGITKEFVVYCFETLSVGSPCIESVKKQ